MMQSTESTIRVKPSKRFNYVQQAANEAQEASAVEVRRIRESGFEDYNLFANFAGEREDLNPKAKDSNLCC
jgi:hypothetical protein